MVELWLDNVRIADLSGATTTVAAPVDGFQIGEAQGTNQIYDVVFDDAAFGTARLGPVADGAAPSVPGSLSATATSAFSVALSWTASTDDVGIAGYDVYRDGTLVASPGNVTTYTDTSVLASTTYSYAVRARDTSGNASGLSAPASATTSAAPVPDFADGFESGDFSGWTSNSGLTIEGTNVRSGSFAAEGVGPVFARKTLSTPSADAYTRVAFFVNSWGTQAALIRLRDASNLSIGNVYLSNIGHVGFHVDVAGSSNTVGITTVDRGRTGLARARAAPRRQRSVLHPGGLARRRPGLGTPGHGGPRGIRPRRHFQIGDSAANSNDILYDDAAYGTSRFGPVADSTAPTCPTGLAATATSAFSVALTWTASTDDVGIGGYDVYRGGTLVGEPRQRHDLHGHDRAGVHCLQLHRARPGHLGQPVGAVRGASRDHAGGGGTGLRRRLRVGRPLRLDQQRGLTIEGTTVRNGANAAEGEHDQRECLRAEVTRIELYGRVRPRLVRRRRPEQPGHASRLPMRNECSIGSVFLDRPAESSGD